MPDNRQPQSVCSDSLWHKHGGIQMHDIGGFPLRNLPNGLEGQRKLYRLPRVEERIPVGLEFPRPQLLKLDRAMRPTRNPAVHHGADASAPEKIDRRSLFTAIHHRFDATTESLEKVVEAHGGSAAGTAVVNEENFEPGHRGWFWMKERNRWSGVTAIWCNVCKKRIELRKST